MKENIKHLRQIIEHNDLTSDTTRAEALTVLDLLEADWRELTALTYHTAPNQLDFAPEGWTWKQQAQRHLMRMGEMEKRIEELEERTVTSDLPHALLAARPRMQAVGVAGDAQAGRHGVRVVVGERCPQVGGV